MEKVIIPSSWNLGTSVVSLVKTANNRILGQDYTCLVKRSSEEFAHQIRNVKMADGEVPVHVIAMGATEGYGPNRNGDGFKEATLIKYHDGFVKDAKHYRHHRNKDKAKSYGVVKLSFYNAPMRRVELLIGLNGTKEAAERNGGLVADTEQEMLASGKDLPVSMACKVAYDVCSSCGNKARNRSEYCDEDTCKHGGCKHNLTKVSEDGHILHVDNPHPKFFDISTVVRPADRIAYGGLVDYLQKAASGEILGGAAIAEAIGIVAPIELATLGTDDPRVVTQVKLAYRLAAIEDDLQQTPNNRDYAVSLAFCPEVQGEFDISPLGRPGSSKCASALSALASQKVVMPINDFVRLISGESSLKCAELSATVPGLLPGVYNRLLSGGTLVEEISSNPFVPSRGLASATQREWAYKHANAFSLGHDHVRTRTSLAAIRSVEQKPLQQTKTASAASGDAERVARLYALYKLAFLAAQTDDVELTADLSIRQNYA